MGMDMRIYVGCYLKIPHYIKSVEMTKYHDKNGRVTDNKFDPQTGEPNRVEKAMVQII